MTTLEERLRSEERICPCCRCKVASPFAERCPRCLTFLPPADPGCDQCLHNSICPVSKRSED